MIQMVYLIKYNRLHLVKHNAKSDVTGGTVGGITGAGCDAVAGTIRGVAQKATAFDQPISVHGGGLSFPSFWQGLDTK